MGYFRGRLARPRREPWVGKREGQPRKKRAEPKAVPVVHIHGTNVVASEAAEISFRMVEQWETAAE